MKQLKQFAISLATLEGMLADYPQTHETINLLKQAHQSLLAAFAEPFTITVKGGIVTEVAGSMQDYVIEDLD